MSTPNEFTLYHGSHNWSGPPTHGPGTKKTREHGPGLYLTTSYDTARRYAKGGGTVLVFALSTEIGWMRNAMLPLADATAFITGLPRLRRRADLLADLVRVAGRFDGTRVPASSLVNLMVNYEVLTGAISPATAGFLAGRGIDADLVNPSAKEDWVVLFNLAKIRSVTPATPAMVERSGAWDLPLLRSRI